MNGYICFFKGRKVEVRANTSFEAQQAAVVALKLKPKQRVDITVVLAEKDGQQVTHVPTM